MTKSKGIGRGVGGGGKKPGAGRKPKQIENAAIAAKVKKAVATIVDIAAGTVDLPRLAIKAYATLEGIIDNDALPAAPRVTAARAIIAIDRESRVERAADEFANVVVGKKAAAAADAAMVISDQDSEWSGLLNPNKPN